MSDHLAVKSHEERTIISPARSPFAVILLLIVMGCFVLGLYMILNRQSNTEQMLQTESKQNSDFGVGIVPLSGPIDGNMSGPITRLIQSYGEAERIKGILF